MQNSPHQNHFQLLNMPRRYDLDLAQLADQYRQLQAQVHPDRFTQADAAARRASMQLAAQANDAYRTLKDPIQRGQYLLSLEQQQDTAHDGRMAIDFLEQQMTLRETLQELPEQSEPLIALGEFQQQVSELFGAKKTQLSDAFQDPDPVTWGAADNLIRELQFLNKLRQEADELEEQLL